MIISPGEKLIIFMLADLYKALKVEHSDINPDFLTSAIASGHYWALDWEYSGLVNAGEPAEAVVKEVVNYLDMWSLIELSHRELPAADKAELEKAVPHYGQKPQMAGFDGNDSARHFGVARFLVEEMGRWREFKDRDLNSHDPFTVERYRSMYEVFGPMRAGLADKLLSLDQLKQILSAAKA